MQATTKKATPSILALPYVKIISLMGKAQHLLQKHGLLILTDSFAQSSEKEGLLNPADRSEKTVLLRSLLEDLRESTVFESLPLPVSDGLTLAFKK